MNSKKFLSILIMGLFLFATSIPAMSEPLTGEGWKKGTVSDVTEYSIKIDGWSHYVSDDLVIKELSGEDLSNDLSVLKATNEILYRIENNRITEIVIFKRAH